VQGIRRGGWTVDPQLICDDLPARVAAGSERRVPLTVVNPGDDPEHYRLEVLGEAARWSRVEPRHVSDVPGHGDATAEVVLRPPAETSVGRRPIGLRAVSLRDPQRCGVVEGEVVVGAPGDMDVAVAAVSPRARHVGHYVIEVRNDGASDADVRLTATDTRQELGFALTPRELSVAAGGSDRAYLSVRPRRPKLAGGEIPHRFTVEHRTGSGTATRVPLRFEQRPVLGRPAAAGTLLLVLGVLAAAGLMLWPTVRDVIADRASSSVAPSAPEATGTTTSDAFRGAVVVWQLQFIDDVAQEGSLPPVMDRLRAEGISARIVESADHEGLPDLGGRPYRALVTDGFPSPEAADAACTDNKNIAPNCTPVGGG
jgi:hypothetical protein